MTGTNVAGITSICIFIGILIGVLLIIFEDARPSHILQKMRCKRGKHVLKTGFYKNINRYFCTYCKAPRQHPSLKIIDGGKKDIDISFKL